MNESEVAVLIGTFVGVACSTPSAVIRRSAANSLAALCCHSRHPRLHLRRAMETLSEVIVSATKQMQQQEQQESQDLQDPQPKSNLPFDGQVEKQLVGVLVCSRYVVPPILNLNAINNEPIGEDNEDDQEESALSKRLLTLFELCLFLLSENDCCTIKRSPLEDPGVSSDRIKPRKNVVIVSSALETLSALLNWAPISQAGSGRNSTTNFVQVLSAAAAPGSSPMFFATWGGNNSTLEDWDEAAVPWTPPLLAFCVRRLVLLFLLDPGSSSLVVSDEVARVSLKVLALGCISHCTTIAPRVFLLPITEEGRTIRVADTVTFAGHDDPQLRGALATLIGIALRGALVESGPRSLSLWFGSSGPSRGSDSQVVSNKDCVV